jgi:hypothetical protein
MPTIRSTSDAFLQLWGQAIVFLHNIVGAAIWLLIGYIVARVVKAVLVKALHAIKFDQIVDRAGVDRALQAAGTRMDAAAVLATVVFWWIFLMFIENAVTALGISTLTTFINTILGYIPNIFAAILILIVGALIANVVAEIVRGAATEAGLTTAGLLATVARWGILLFAALSALTQLNVAQNMIFILFAGLVTMLAIAGGLAFGLGGVDSAGSLLAGQAMSSMLQPGQQVQIGNQTGKVVRHDMNATVLDTGNGLTSIPNAALAKEQVTVLNGSGQR